MKLRIGVLGLGESWEKRYKPALRVLSDRFELRYVCDPVAHLASQVAREFDATPVEGFRALARRPDLDAVMIFSRPWYGTLPILAVCEVGKSVYSCCGFDMDPANALQLKQRIEQAGVAFMAEFPRRHASATTRLKELIATRLGRPRLLFAHLRRSAEKPSNGRAAMEATNPAARDLMELIDWCRFVVGREPTSVVSAAHGSRESFFDVDYQMMSLEFADPEGKHEPVLAQLSCGRYMPAYWHEAINYRPPAALQVACENGIAFIDLPSTVVWFDKMGRNMETLDHERPVGETILLQFHRDVTSLIRKGSSLDDAYNALQTVLAAERSFREERRIPLEFGER